MPSIKKNLCHNLSAFLEKVIKFQRDMMKIKKNCRQKLKREVCSTKPEAVPEHTDLTNEEKNLLKYNKGLLKYNKCKSKTV